jgi:hypothetical protein
VQGLKKEVLALPTLVFWAGDDTTVPYHRVKDLLDYFGDREVVLFEHVVSEGRQAWEAHTPELIKVSPIPPPLYLSSLFFCSTRNARNVAAYNHRAIGHMATLQVEDFQNTVEAWLS